MIDRRECLKWGVATPAMAGLAWPGGAAALGEAGLDAFVLDTRVASEGPTDLPVHAISGDVTQLWVEVLDARWRREGYVLGGITGSDALFVIEQLAWDRGRRVASRNILPANAEQPFRTVSWVIAPFRRSMVA